MQHVRTDSNAQKNMPDVKNVYKKAVLNDSDVLTKSSWRHGAARSARKIVNPRKLLPYILGAHKRKARLRGMTKASFDVRPMLPARVPAQTLLMPGRVLRFVAGPKNKMRAIVQNQLH